MSQHFVLDLVAHRIGLCVRTATDHAPRNLEEAAIDQSERRDARDLAGTAAQAGGQIGVLGVDSWQRQGGKDSRRWRVKWSTAITATAKRP